MSVSAQTPTRHRLADFIRHHQAAIVEEWVAFARTRSPASEGMTKLALKDHVVDILRFVVTDIETPQTSHEHREKSLGLDADDDPAVDSAAEVHATLRLADGFDIDQMVSEYRALRASVVRQWTAQQGVMDAQDVYDLTRFNEAIDQAMTESIAHYTKTINASRNLFLGILGHDLRNPITAASMAAAWLKRSGTIDAKQGKVVSELGKALQRATRMLNDLFDLTRSSFGTDIPVSKSDTDMAALCEDIADELRHVHQDRRIIVSHKGDPRGRWDPARMGQVLSNLLGNASQHGDGAKPITVTVAGDKADTVRISVHNHGAPIPAESQKTIFESWMRGQAGETSEQPHLGLGLYIAKLIVEAHTGTIELTSDEAAGTTFMVELPRE
ncbi:sensor histidine kinase [Rhodopseudomonas palustris]|uniref:histidine kinase n=1 Tax=Rhodopseudomonas palustris TaxID=1076 RepID=A0A418VKA6_RHOPL|nr:sensor histidine kinase [Rhodopseudomonas palustris]RJF76575.1 hypothetical protein D4Q52_05375 [Rhodopseudomonas palustris]